MARKRLLAVGAALSAIVCAGAAALSENFTMTTYYPSPSGVYRRLVSTAQTLLARDGGSVGIGTSSPRGALDVNSTTGAFLPPRMTTAQRNALAPVAGSTIFNTQTRSLEVYNGSGWDSLTSKVLSGVARVGFSNGQPHSTIVTVSFPRPCDNPIVVVNGVGGSLNSLCGDASHQTNCLAFNMSNSQDLIAGAFDITRAGFKTYLSGMSGVWVGASSPAFPIHWIAVCR